HTGTLFIDEISELSLPLQAKLLRVIQTREFVKVGGSKPTRTDIRLITASNKDLRRAVREGQFREDLYYRIAGGMIGVPRLRGRRGGRGGGGGGTSGCWWSIFCGSLRRRPTSGCRG